MYGKTTFSRQSAFWLTYAWPVACSLARPLWRPRYSISGPELLDALSSVFFLSICLKGSWIPLVLFASHRALPPPSLCARALLPCPFSPSQKLSRFVFVFAANTNHCILEQQWFFSAHHAFSLILALHQDVPVGILL